MQQQQQQQQAAGVRWGSPNKKRKMMISVNQDLILVSVHAAALASEQHEQETMAYRWKFASKHSFGGLEPAFFHLFSSKEKSWVPEE